MVLAVLAVLAGAAAAAASSNRGNVGLAAIEKSWIDWHEEHHVSMMEEALSDRHFERGPTVVGAGSSIVAPSAGRTDASPSPAGRAFLW